MQKTDWLIKGPMMDDAAIWTCLQCCEKKIEIVAVFLENPVITVTNVMRCFVLNWNWHPYAEKLMGEFVIACLIKEFEKLVII